MDAPPSITTPTASRGPAGAQGGGADDGLAPPMDLWHHLSHNTKLRKASNIKAFYKYFQIPGIGQLAGGLPSPDYFPFDNLSATIALPDRFEPTPNDPVEPLAGIASTAHGGRRGGKKGAGKPPPSTQLLVPKDSGATDALRKIDLASALQYGLAQGYPPLLQFIKHFTINNLHPNIPYAGGPDVCLTIGSTDGFYKALEAFNDEWREGKDDVAERPALLCEEFAYMLAISAAAPRGMNIAPVAVDAEGMKADGERGLADVLENWDFSRGRRPHMMYTVTVGQNPTSGVLSLGRRKAIYALCQKYDIIIVEDDPYWYLQYPSATSSSSSSSSDKTNDAVSIASTEPPKKSSGYDFLDSLVPSYLSIDVDGRVVRLDTFSKTIAPGCRLGWITAQPVLVERILRIGESSTQQPSGFVQSMVAELIMGPQSKHDPGVGGGKGGKGWNVDGWVRWLEGLRGNYERRMQVMSDILDEGIVVAVDDAVSPARRAPSRAKKASSARGGDDEFEWVSVRKRQIYSFDRPQGGMFLWLKVLFDAHPLADRVAAPRLAQALFVFWTMKPYLVLVSPGTIFSPTPEIRDRDGWKYFRLCFAACPDDELADISHRMVKGAHDFWHITDVDKIDELVDGNELGAAVGDLTEAMSNLGGPC